MVAVKWLVWSPYTLMNHAEVLSFYFVNHLKGAKTNLNEAGMAHQNIFTQSRQCLGNKLLGVICSMHKLFCLVIL